ncbi:unnamed protein product [Withania somnifera]
MENDRNDAFGDTPSRKEKKGDQTSVVVPETAHQVSNDSWFQVGVVLSMGVNSAYALGYSGTIMVPLGWVGGVVGLVLATVVSLYASALMAKLHEVGGKRHIRFRDLAGFLYVVPMHAVTYIGYWAYGSGVSSYLLNNVHGPAWLLGVAHLSAFFQAIITLHIFASPTYEYLDTKYGIEGSSLAPQNIVFRLVVRGGYLIMTTFLSALLPFLGNFMSLTGAISTIPLTFILPNHMYIKSWHWLNIVVFGCMSVAAFVAALKLTVVETQTYHVFADL